MVCPSHRALLVFSWDLGVQWTWVWQLALRRIGHFFAAGCAKWMWLFLTLVHTSQNHISNIRGECGRFGNKHRGSPGGFHLGALEPQERKQSIMETTSSEAHQLFQGPEKTLPVMLTRKPEETNKEGWKWERFGEKTIQWNEDLELRWLDRHPSTSLCALVFSELAKILHLL